MTPETKPTGRPGLGIALGLLATLLLLAAHAREYSFLTDDAFISFRYARNLADGHGLVFNPGHDRVEGYTNFLWVILLAGPARVGIPPETAAPLMSFAATLALWALVAGYAIRRAPPGAPRWLALVPLVWLGVTRSVAVWSTGGLETRLFEVLVLGGALRLVDEIEAARARDDTVRPVAAMLFGLAALTRPDGLLVGGVALAAAALVLRRGGSMSRLVRSAAVFGGIVAAHYLFRLAYYGEILPNTYYAKVAGRTSWGIGLAHHASFLLEYGALLWIPGIFAAVRRHVRESSGHVPLVFGAIVGAHALYVAAIGGDHFEYRPQDLYFPFAFLLLHDGAMRVLPGRNRPLAAGGYAALVAAGLVVLPFETHRQFPDEYLSGFPGRAMDETAARDFLEPSRAVLTRVPILAQAAATHRSLVRRTTSRFVGVRQEEHRLFLAKVMPEARRLQSLVERGSLPRDAHFAMSCVGAIPYYSNLRVLDRHGLTDAGVARTVPTGEGLAAHEKRATLSYARERGVDFWAFDPVHSLWSRDAPAFRSLVATARAREIPVYLADAGDGYFFLGLLPLGPQSAAKRLPSLQFRAVADLDFGPVPRP